MQHSHTISLIIWRCLIIESSQASFFSTSTKFMDAGCFQLFIMIFAACCFSLTPGLLFVNFPEIIFSNFPKLRRGLD